MSCSGGWAPARREICSGRSDFRAKVGLLFGDVMLPTMHLNCNWFIAMGRAVQGGEAVQEVVSLCR